MGATEFSTCRRGSRDAARVGLRQRRRVPQDVAPAARIVSEWREILGHLAMLEGWQSPSEPRRALDTTLLSPDPLDRAQAITVEREVSATRQILASRLATLRRAAEKVGDGTYGRCDDCARPITTARLQAIPEATRCLSCAEQAEARAWRERK
jgi:RNA polymerase-binding transcription factor